MKAVYDFIVFCGCEIGKHNYTLRLWVWVKTEAALSKVKKWFGLYKPVLEQKAKPKLPLFYRICKICLYCFIALFLFNLVYIALREKFGLQGCVMCEEVHEIVQTKTNEIVKSGIRKSKQVHEQSNILYNKVLYHGLHQIEDLH